mmetsp:Transcript_17124/g.32576  ORF Transcript_17124/g.32576 Transcript_17124/m.32576 type:complete len:95 (+) Transcript_17124:168-452(+)
MCSSTAPSRSQPSPRIFTVSYRNRIPRLLPLLLPPSDESRFICVQPKRSTLAILALIWQNKDNIQKRKKSPERTPRVKLQRNTHKHKTSSTYKS